MKMKFVIVAAILFCGPSFISAATTARKRLDGTVLEAPHTGKNRTCQRPMPSTTPKASTAKSKQQPEGVANLNGLASCDPKFCDQDMVGACDGAGKCVLEEKIGVCQYQKCSIGCTCSGEEIAQRDWGQGCHGKAKGAYCEAYVQRACTASKP